MANDIDLKGRIAVVTGGAQGFGKAITERFVKSGARVAIWDRDIALRAEDRRRRWATACTAIACDVADAGLGRQGARGDAQGASGASTSSSTTPASPAPTPRPGRPTSRNGAR